MKITIVGSIAFAKNMVELYHRLEEMGHRPQMLKHMFGIADGSETELISGIKEDHGKLKRQQNFIKRWHELIKSGDALLVCNMEKNGKRNYIGGNVLMEMGFAHVNDKKIFLYNDIPVDSPFVDEIRAMVDVALGGDLKRIGKI